MEKRERELLEITLLERLKTLIDKTLYYSHKENIENETEIDSYLEDNYNSRKNIYSLISELSKDRSIEETRNLIDKVNMRISLFETNRIREYLMNSEFSMFKEDIDRFISSIENKFNEVEKEIEEVIENNPESVTTIIIEKTNVDLPEKDDEDTGHTQRLLKIIDERIESLEKEAISNQENTEINFFKKDNPTFEPTNENDLNNLFNPFNEEIVTENSDVKEVSLEPREEVKTEETPQDAFEFSREIGQRLNNDLNGSERLTQDEIDGFIKKIDDKLAELEKEEKALDVTRFDIPII